MNLDLLTSPTGFQKTFRHYRFLESYTAARIFVNALSRPLVVCLMPVMICTLFLALQELQIGFFLKSGTSIAVLCATGWTFLQLGRTPAIVSFRNDRVLIKTFLEASLKPNTRKWDYVIDVKVIKNAATPTVTAVTYGHTAFEFKEEDWANLKELTHYLFEAKRHYGDKVKASVT